jgi:hypothetical protein
MHTHHLHGLKFGCLAVALALCGSPAVAAVIGKWAFEVNTPPGESNTAFTNPFHIGYQPDSGAAPPSSFGAPHVIGSHVSGGTDWTTPAGNSSATSLAGNEWAIGDVFFFHLASTGFQNISIDWDQTRSSTGPQVFQLRYSTDGGTYTDFGPQYQPTETWAHFSRDLSSITALNDKTDIYLSLTAMSLPGDAAGTSSIDNIVISGTPVPESSSLTLLAIGIVPLLRRRRI